MLFNFNRNKLKNPSSNDNPTSESDIKKVPYLASLSISSFRWLWFGTILQMGAVQMGMTARTMVVDDITNSAFLSGVVAMGFAPSLLVFAIIGGWVGDKFDNRSIIQFCLICFTLVSASIGLLIAFEAIHWIHLFIASLFQGALFSLQMPSRQSLIPKLVPKSLIGNGVALIAASMATISIFSGAGIGLLYGSLGPSYVFLIISILYVISFILTSQIPSTKQIKENQNNQGLLGSTKESIAYLFYNKMILGIFLSSILVSLFALPVRLQLPIIARRLYEASSNEIGLLLSISSIGAVLASLFIASLSKSKLRGFIFLLGIFGLSACVFLLGVFPYFIAGIIIWILFGIFENIRMTLSQSLTLEYVDENFRSRIMGLYMMNYAFIPLGALPIGKSIDVFGAEKSLLIFSLIFFISSVLVLISSKELRKIR